jgi:Holliday junction resolvase
MMSEKQVEQKLREGIKKLGGIAYKFTSPGNVGVPDRIIILPGGEIYFIEVKTEIGKLSKLQRSQLKKITQLGAKAFTLYGIDDVNGFLRDCAAEEPHEI